MEIIIAILVIVILAQFVALSVVLKKHRTVSTHEAPKVDMSAYFSTLSQEQWKDYLDDPAKVSHAFQQFQLASIAAERAITLSQDHYEAARELIATAKREAKNGYTGDAKKALKASKVASVNSERILFSRYTEDSENT